MPAMQVLAKKKSTRSWWATGRGGEERELWSNDDSTDQSLWIRKAQTFSDMHGRRAYALLDPN